MDEPKPMDHQELWEFLWCRQVASARVGTGFSILSVRQIQYLYGPKLSKAIRCCIDTNGWLNVIRLHWPVLQRLFNFPLTSLDRFHTNRLEIGRFFTQNKLHKCNVQSTSAMLLRMNCFFRFPNELQKDQSLICLLPGHMLSTIWVALITNKPAS